MGVLERGAGVGALVDDQVHVGGVSAWARIRSRQAATAPAKRSSASSASEVACSGRVDDHLVGARRPAASANRSGSPPAVDGAAAGRSSSRGPVSRAALAAVAGRSAVRAARAPGRGSAPTAPSSRASRARRRPGGRAQTSGGVRSSRPSQNGQRLGGVRPRLAAGAGSKASGRSARPGREDRPQPGELVDADLGGAQDCAVAVGGCGGRAGAGTLGSRRGSRNGLIRSIGSGKTIVEFWLTPISSSVCR